MNVYFVMGMCWSVIGALAGVACERKVQRREKEYATSVLIGAILGPVLGVIFVIAAVVLFLKEDNDRTSDVR